MPKRGYRFLPEVIRITEETAVPVFQEQFVQETRIEESIEVVSSSDENEITLIDGKILETPKIKSPPAAPAKRLISPLWIIPLVLFFGISAFAVYSRYFSQDQPKLVSASKVVPFSGLPGRENSPAFSPDGNQLVFSWDGGIEGANPDIYVKLIGTGEPVRLTNTETEEINPTFSPDGKSIAFVRVFPNHNEIILIPALGGAERKIFEKASYASISFSPDGKLLAAAELESANKRTGIFTINLQTAEKTQITKPEMPFVDHTPRFSPDGKSIAFIRYFSSFRREIFVVSAAGGESRQITFDDAQIYGLGWNADSREMFITSFRAADQLNLWKIFISGKEKPQMISTGSRNLADLAISPNGKNIAFVEETNDENIWEIESGEPPKPLIRSTRSDHSQQFSFDGSQIVFVSDRTGNYEIWIADGDGKNQRQLTDSHESKGSPRFSPDGESIVYDAQNGGIGDIYVVSVNSGVVRRLTDNGKNNSLPAWSVDGNSIFFISNRSGSDQIWKVPLNGNGAMQNTTKGAFEIFAAPDGKTVIYSKGGGKSGLWSVKTDGSDEKPLAELADAGVWRSWSVTPNGIYYTAFATQIPLHIKFYDFTSGQTREVSVVDKTPLQYYSNLTVSTDGKRILYARQDQTNSSIMLAELSQ